MTAQLFIPHEHHRHHRHKRFHVRPEAKGVGYRKFLGVPGHGAHRAAEPEAKPENQPSQEAKERSVWDGALISVVAFLFVWLVLQGFGVLLSGFLRAGLGGP